MLLEHRPLLIKSFVAAEIHNEGKFHASDVDATRAKAGFAECFQCGVAARNVCRWELAALGLGSRFEQMKVAWNRYIDSLGNASLRDAQVVFTLRCQNPEGAVGACMVLDRQGGELAKVSGCAEVFP